MHKNSFDQRIQALFVRTFIPKQLKPGGGIVTTTGVVHTGVRTAKTKDQIIRTRQQFGTKWDEVTLIVYQPMNDDWEERQK